MLQYNYYTHYYIITATKLATTILNHSLPLLPLYIILCGIHFVQQKKKTTISRKMGVAGVTAYQWGAGSFEKYIIL